MRGSGLFGLLYLYNFFSVFPKLFRFGFDFVAAGRAAVAVSFRPLPSTPAGDIYLFIYVQRNGNDNNDDEDKNKSSLLVYLFPFT